MTRNALTVIREEHQALSAMLRSMLLLLAQARREHKPPDFALLRAMLFYVDEFPERLHHPKESTLLFPKVLARCPELADTLKRLDHDHDDGEHSVRRLAHALLAWEVLGEPRRLAFEQALQKYVHDYLRHMSIEEHEVLPAARDHLSPDDWAELDAAFAQNRDPLAGHGPQDAVDDVYAPLFRRILNTAPAPIGLG